MARDSKYTYLETFVINLLRRGSIKWPAKNTAKQRARVQRGLYECAKCKGAFAPKGINLDHIIPVIDPDEGFIDFNTYIERLFCDADNYRVLCKKCHAVKTKAENKRRRKDKS